MGSINCAKPVLWQNYTTAAAKKLSNAVRLTEQIICRILRLTFLRKADVYMMESVLFLDTQAERPGCFCCRCGSECYSPTFACLRCERRCP